MSGCDNPACQQIQPPCLLDPGVARYITPPWVVRRPPKNPSVLSDQSALFQQELPSSVTERFSTNIWCLSERGEGRKKKVWLETKCENNFDGDCRSTQCSGFASATGQRAASQLSELACCRVETAALSTFPTGTFISSTNLLPFPLLHKGQ